MGLGYMYFEKLDGWFFTVRYVFKIIEGGGPFENNCSSYRG